MPDYIIQPNPDNPQCDGGVSYESTMNRLSFTNKTIRSLRSKNTMVVIPSDFICNYNIKKCRVVMKGKLIYHDRYHLNYFGSIVLALNIEKEFVRFVTTDDSSGILQRVRKNR